MALDQMLCPFNLLPGIDSAAAGSSEGGRPAQVCALLAHLLMLRAAGGLRTATALADTFGTAGFVAAALASRVPPAFREDMAASFPDDWAALPPCCTGADAVVFDLFRVWRIDSGDYAQLVGAA